MLDAAPRRRGRRIRSAPAAADEAPSGALVPAFHRSPYHLFCIHVRHQGLALQASSSRIHATGLFMLAARRLEHLRRHLADPCALTAAAGSLERMPGLPPFSEPVGTSGKLPAAKQAGVVQSAAAGMQQRRGAASAADAAATSEPPASPCLLPFCSCCVLLAP